MITLFEQMTCSSISLKWTNYRGTVAEFQQFDTKSTIHRLRCMEMFYYNFGTLNSIELRSSQSLQSLQSLQNVMDSIE